MMAAPTVVNVEAIPAALRSRAQWVCWRYATRPSEPKPTKVPINARTGTAASSTDPATWSAFDDALAATARYGGIGWVFAAGAGVVGLDLDNCRDPETGAIEPWAVEVLGDTRSYTEVSPSGRGLHVFLLGTLPSGARKRGSVELYDRERYFTVTGDRLEEMPADIRAPHLPLDALHAKLFPPAPALERNGAGLAVPVTDLDDAALLDKARGAANGAKFAALYDAGDWAGAGYPSHSEADLGLCVSLAFWTGRDAARVDRLFRTSALMREKWDDGRGAQTYGARTVDAALARCAEVYAQRVAPVPAAPAAGDGPVLVQLSTVTPEAVAWCWPGRIAFGKLGLLIGDPGTGKSTVGYDVTARVTAARGWPDGDPAPDGAVLILSAEDGLADTVRPRVDTQGGDATRVYVLRAVRLAGQECPFNLDRDLPALEQAIRETGARVVMVDPLSAYLGGRDSFKDSDLRGLLTPLADLAERTAAAILGVLHLTKGAQRRLLLRAQGNIAFVAQARTVLAVGEDPDTPGRRLLVCVKSNLGPTPPALAFRLTDAGLVWESTPVEGFAEDLLAMDEPGSRTDRKERDVAKQFLIDTLTGGPVASKEIYGDARANGIAPRTLERAKTDLGVTAARQGRGPWYWMLPAPETHP